MVTAAAPRRMIESRSTISVVGRFTRNPSLDPAIVMEMLGRDRGCPELGLPALGSLLWSREAVADLAGSQIANHDLLDAIRALAFTIEGRVRRAVRGDGQFSHATHLPTR